MVELMVVIAIIAILVAVLAIGFAGVGTQARVKATRACGDFKAAFGFYPPDATGASASPAGWQPGDPPPWNDGERCIYVRDTRVDSTELYIGMLEYLGLGNPSGTVEPAEALAFSLLVQRNGGPFLSVDQKFLANADGDTYQPYLDENNDGERQSTEDVGGVRPLVEVVDAWGRELRYISPAGRNNNDMDALGDRNAVLIYSAGPNEVFGEDDGIDNDDDGTTDELGELDEDDISNLRAE